MAYDKNRGRAAGTPSFYKTVGQKHTHGENTGEWTREQRARHEQAGHAHPGSERAGKGRRTCQRGERRRSHDRHEALPIVQHADDDAGRAVRR